MARFDDLRAHARRAGQKLAFRIMCAGSGSDMEVPVWLKEQGCKGVEYTYGGGKHWVPEFADPLFQEMHSPKAGRRLRRCLNSARRACSVNATSAGAGG